ncbi:MAG: uroporphyrinogen-III synthase [Acidobacteriota bacterium]
MRIGSNRAPRPLGGKRIWVTRAARQSEEFALQLRRLGAEVVEIPTIEIITADPAPIDRSVSQLEQYDWILFTSVNGVRFFADRLVAAPGAPRLGAVGPATARALEQLGLVVSVLPARFDSEGLAEALQADGQGVRGCRILLPRGEQATSLLPKSLRQLGATVDTVVVYRTVLAEKSRRRIAELATGRPPDIVTFTSTSSVRNFVELVTPELLQSVIAHATVAAIGPVTASTARGLGLHIGICPAQATIESLVDAIAVYRGEESRHVN